MKECRIHLTLNTLNTASKCLVIIIVYLNFRVALKIHSGKKGEFKIELSRFYDFLFFL